MKIILDLCGGTGAWSRPYSGYDVRIIDNGLKVADYKGPWDVHGIIAAPPCTEFAVSGARWWKDKDPALLESAIRVVRDCLSIIRSCNPVWWVLENPVGRLQKCVPELGKWKMTYNPCDYGDPYTKRTCLWGNFNIPVKTPVDPIEGSKLWKLPPSADRAMLRSITPPGFANAFFEANP